MKDTVFLHRFVAMGVSFVQLILCDGIIKLYGIIHVI